MWPSVCWRIQGRDVLRLARWCMPALVVSALSASGCEARVRIGDVSPKAGHGDPKRDARAEARDANARDAQVEARDRDARGEDRDGAVADASAEMDASVPP